MCDSAGKMSAVSKGLPGAARPRRWPQDDVHGLPDQDTLIRVDADERSLILRAQDGDAAAFSRLVERHWTWLVHFARSVVGDAEAEDCVQDGLVIAWSKLVALRQPDALRGWILRLKKVAPAYPEDARQDRVSGVVVLQLLIGTDGKVHDVEVLQDPDPRLTKAAVEAVKQWEFQPARDKDGKPLSVKSSVILNFALK
jgi:TonB family protein